MKNEIVQQEVIPQATAASDECEAILRPTVEMAAENSALANAWLTQNAAYEYEQFKKGDQSGSGGGIGYASFKLDYSQATSSQDFEERIRRRLGLEWSHTESVNARSLYRSYITDKQAEKWAECKGSGVLLLSAAHPDKDAFPLRVIWRPQEEPKAKLHLAIHGGVIEATSAELEFNGATKRTFPVYPEKNAKKVMIIANIRNLTDELVVNLIPPTPPDPIVFHETLLNKTLLLSDSVANVWPEEACKIWGVDWCVKGLTFNRPYWQTHDGVVMTGVSAPYNQSGIGMHAPKDPKKIAHASFLIPPGAKWFRSFVGFAEHDKCGIHAGDATVVILLDGVPVLQFGLRGRSGPPKDLVTNPINVSGHLKLSFQVDSNGDNNCDSVFFAGARFTG